MAPYAPCGRGICALPKKKRGVPDIGFYILKTTHGRMGDVKRYETTWVAVRTQETRDLHMSHMRPDHVK